ncbi:MAG TPA: hypothetical protein VNT60_08895 [Deinococcales bacterium]|nr:hypothetical protein [Deinococcales bacterium]
MLDLLRGNRLDLLPAGGERAFFLAGQALVNGDLIEVRGQGKWIPARFFWSGKVERWPRVAAEDPRASTADLAVLRRFNPESLCRHPD